MACTLYALLAYRIGCYIPVPGIDPAAFERVMALEDRSVLS
jgi:preprotein translocase subunit SecY